MSNIISFFGKEFELCLTNENDFANKNNVNQITYKMKVKQGQSSYSPTYKFGNNVTGGSASKKTI